MKWSFPLVELSRIAARYVSPLFAGAAIFTVAVLPLTAGCSALPVMKNAATDVALLDDALGTDGYSDAERLRLSELPAIPDFDVKPVAPTATAVAATVKDSSAANVAAEEPKGAANAAVGDKVVAAENNPTPEKVSTKIDSTPHDVVKLPNTKIEPSTAIALVTTDKSAPSDATPAMPGAGKMATVAPEQKPVQVPMLRIDAPKPFGWTPVGKTTGNRSFQTVSVGDEGYRTLVVGSVAGNDPLAIELVEQMARHLHDGKTILGGFQATIIRTLNPDGEALKKVFNEKGQYINHGFPKDNGVADGDQPVEVSFLMEQIRVLKPQRIIHVRSVEGSKGVIATTVASQPVANDAADWLGFRVIKLPDVAVSGSLERYLASSGSCEVLTFALPSSIKKKELWERYGDALQNLLMGDDAAAREMARQPKPQSSANRSNADEK